MASFKDFLKKAVKYSNPVIYAADKAKDTLESPYAAGRGSSGRASTTPVQDAVPVYDNVITVDGSGTKNTDGGSYYGGGYGYRSGTGTQVDPLAALRQTVQDKFKGLQGVFDSIYGDVDNLIREKTSQLNKTYDTQLTDMTKGFERGVGQNSMIYGARGLGDSSYLGDAQGQLKDSYDREVGSMTDARQGQLADLGRYGATQKAGFDAIRQQYQSAINNVGAMDEAGLQSLSGNIDGAVANANVQRAGMGTQGDFINKLNAVTPAQQQFTQQLATKLQNLITSSAPVYAKKQIAQGLIKGSVLDDANAQNYWGNYFNDLLSENGMS